MTEQAQQKEAQTTHLDLWNKVSDTNPLFTKDFTRGSFTGTSINPTYLIQKATEMWGPMGLGWGTKVINERFEEGAPLGMMGEKVVYSKMHIVHLELWYTENDKVGSVSQFGQTTFIGKNAAGDFYTDEDVAKKSMTDALTKCLSLLGFSADIFMGTFDGKNDSQETTNASKATKQPTKTVETKAATSVAGIELDGLSEDAKKFISALQNAPLNRVGLSEKTIGTRFGSTEKDYQAVKAAIAQRKEAIKKEEESQKA